MMKETIIDGYEMMECVEEMNLSLFENHNSVRVWWRGQEILDLGELEIVVYNDEEQD